MKCALCERHFDPEQQAPICPHSPLDPPKPRKGGPRLHPEIQRQLEDAYELRQRDVLQDWVNTSLNLAARMYAQHFLNRLEETEKNENEPTLY